MTKSRKMKNSLAGLRNYPDDFDELFTLITSTEEINIKEEKIQENNFFKWLNSKKTPCHFWNAKQRMIKAGLIPPVDFVSLNNPNILIKKYQLEYTCILCTHYFIFNESILTQVPALTPDIEKIHSAVCEIKEQAETKGIMPFQNNIVYQILLRSIDILLKDGGNKSIYSTAKIYPELGRETMFRWFVKSLFHWYLQADHNKAIKNGFIKNIALDLTEQFFELRISTVPLDTIPNIRAEVIETTRLCGMTISDFLGLHNF